MTKGKNQKLTGGFAPDLFKKGLFWSLLRWGGLAAMAGLIVVSWGRRGIPQVTAPDPLMYTNLGNLIFWVFWLMGIVWLAPVLGRAWCGVCPLGALNEVTARLGLKRSFPRLFRNQNLKALALAATLLLMGVYRIHHYPAATSYYILAWTAAAVVMGLVFSGRSLCAYLCPVGGMLGQYGQTAPVAFGVRDQKVCRDCPERECVRGAVKWVTAGWGRLKTALRVRTHPCPVNLRVWDLDGPDRCLMCFNCMRACPLDNVALFVRRPLGAVWDGRYPRFSDAVLLSALTGFMILTFSRFWPPLQEFLALPVTWMGPLLGEASRPVLIIWLGLGLPLLTVFIPASIVVWGRNSTSGDARRDGAGEKGFPLRVWLEPMASPGPGEKQTEEKIVGSDTIRGLSALYARPVIPLLLSSHLVLALVKLNTKLAYLPAALSDPAGVRSYMAIWELGIAPVPAMLFPLGAVRAGSLALLVVGSVLSFWSYRKISGREGRAALPMLFPMVFLTVVVYGGFFHWLF